MIEEQNETVDRRVKRSRRLLRQALMDLMGEKRFTAITIQDITDRAEVNRGTFYTHFQDKYALLELIMQDGLRNHLADRLPEAARWERENLRILIQTVLELFEEVYGRCPPAEMTNLLLRQTVLEQINQLLLHWLEQVGVSERRWSVPAETIALMASWSILGVAVQRCQEEEKSDSIEQATQHILTVIMDGVAWLVPDGVPG